jgi:alpha-ketoglutarate-dependent taurine dioxygenase
MKARLINNSWPVEITDFDFNTATQHDINLLGCLVNHYTLVLVKHQSNALPVLAQENACKMFGSTLLDRIDANGFKEVTKNLKHPDGDITLRVTGELDQDGKPGLFGFDHELEWHANKVEQPHRRSMVWLYGERGTSGSITEFTNHVLAYQDLDQDTKDQIRDLKINYKGTFPYVSPKYDHGKTSAGWHTPPLVFTNPGGQTGIHLSWLHMDYYEGLTVEESAVITDRLTDHILSNPAYRYQHHWQDGDILLTEQWLGVHRRPAFKNMTTRVLDRIETNFDHIDFSKLPEALELIK